VLGLALLAACGPITIGEVASSDDDSGTPDTTDPETVLLSGPPLFVNTNSVEFEFFANEGVSRFEAQVYSDAIVPGGDWETVTSPHVVQVAGDGPWTFECRAIDHAENVDDTPIRHTWMLDTQAPTPPPAFTVVPTQTTSLQLDWSSAADEFSGVEGYRIVYFTSPPAPPANEGASGFTVGLLNTLRLTGLAPCRVYTVRIAAIDRAGNVSAEVERQLRTWCGWDGTFQEAELTSVGATPETLLAHDFSGDGVVDLAVQTTQDVRLLAGDGSGGFDVSAPPFAAGTRPIAIATGHFDDDFSLDLVALDRPPSGSAQVFVFRGQCAGGLAQVGIVTAFLPPGLTCLAAAGWHSTVGNVDNQPVEDMEGDAVTDLFLGGTLAAHYYLGCKTEPSGNDPCNPATFQRICDWNAVDPLVACTTVDFDGDGLPEVVGVTDTGFVSVLLTQITGGGDISNYCGGMGNPAPTASFAGFGASSVASGDLDGDGNADIVVGNGSSSRISVLFGNGAGGFSAPVEHEVGAPSHAIALADLGGDGIVDVVAATDEGFTVLVGQGTNGVGDGTFALAVTGAIGAPARDVDVADLDGDGILDLALTVPDLGAIAVVRGAGATGAGTGWFSSPAFPLSLTQRAVDVTSGDVDGDGILDLLVGSPDEITNVYLGNGSGRRGDGTFRYGSSYAYGPGLDREQLERRTGDFDGDGLADLACCSCQGNAFNEECSDQGSTLVRLGTGDAGDALGPELSGPTTTLRRPIAFDFDRDGFDDLAAIALTDGRPRVSRGSPVGSLNGPPFPISGAFPEDWQALTAADLDRDGRLDLAAVTGSEEIQIALQRQPVGDPLPGFVAQAGLFPIDTVACPGLLEARGAALVAADLDGDGIVDLAVTGESPVYVLRGSLPVGCGGTVTFGAATCVAAGSTFVDLMSGEFTGDGAPDLLAIAANEVVLLVGNGDGSFLPPRTLLAGAHLAVTTGDFDADGTLDLALSNPTPTLDFLFGGAAPP
jgi:hypothetical protein